MPSQGILFPERVELTLNESIAMETVSAELASLGFDISSLGGTTFVVNGVPSELDGVSPVELLVDLLHTAAENGTDATDKVHERMALSMAKKIAIVPGQVLSAEEMKIVVDGLFASSMPSHTPDGCKILHIMTDADIERFF